LCRAPLRRRGQSAHERGVGEEQRQMAAERGRRGVCKEPHDEARDGSKGVCELDRPAQGRHQRTARGLRLREDQQLSRHPPSPEAPASSTGGGAGFGFAGGAPCSEASFLRSASAIICSWYCGIAESTTATCTPFFVFTTSIEPVDTRLPLSGLVYSKR